MREIISEQPGPGATRIVIVGGGFAGLTAARCLARACPRTRITLFDRHNYHLFQPLLYQVATGGLSPGEIATPIRTILAPFPQVQVLLGKVSGVDLAARTVATETGLTAYDYLILACGAQHSYFGHEEWEEFAPGLKTLEQAIEIRRRVLTAFELAERESDPGREQELLTFVVVGGGPTGVELAGALGEITRFTINRDFRHIDPSRARIILIEAGQRILPSFAEELSHQAARDLEALGVTIWASARVTRVSQDAVTLGAETIKAATIIWAAGVQPSSLNATLGVPLDRGGRVIVGPDLAIPGHPEVFVLGDQACFMENDQPLPGLASVALQQGRAVASLIAADLEGGERPAFHYKDKGQMATIGRSRAVVQTKRLRLSGAFAWILWLTIHIYYLIGFKNRLIVLIQWLWSYITFKRGAQLIESKEWRFFKKT
jgi:NADH dehydrogenase